MGNTSKKWGLWFFRKNKNENKTGRQTKPPAKDQGGTDETHLVELEHKQLQKQKGGKFKSLKKNSPPPVFEVMDAVQRKTEPSVKHRTLTPGSDGEHQLQQKYETKQRAQTFYNRQVLDYLSPNMQEFVRDQEFLFVATADSHGECDCTSKFGQPGFIRVLSDKHLMYPEYRGNGVLANLGNISENPHIAMLMMDFCKHTIGLHVNGKARTVENAELLQFADKISKDVLDEIHREGKKQPERWVMVEVEEAYIQCSKHIPLMKKLDKSINWGTDDDVAKGGDFFQLQDIPLYDRVGGGKAMDIVVDHFYRKVLKDEILAPFFEDVDMDAQRQKQKGFLTMAFGGPHDYSIRDMRNVHKRLVEEMGLNDSHFDRLMAVLKETFQELEIHGKEIDRMLEILETTRDDVLNR